MTNDLAKQNEKIVMRVSTNSMIVNIILSVFKVAAGFIAHSGAIDVYKRQPFYDLYEKEVYQETDEELDRAMYHTAVQILAEEDYHQYEISNFAKDGKESRHNRIYWQDEGYLGFGLGAHSYWAGKRFHNPYDLHTYMEQAENGNVSRCV